jgi:hypothetical protein
LIYIDASGAAGVAGDPTQGPYDSVEDTLIGVQNNSRASITSLPLAATTGKALFGFDGDGLCSTFNGLQLVGCPFGPTGYEGPGVTFTNISADLTSGTVHFSPAVPPGGHSYFSLEEALATVPPFDLNPGPPVIANPVLMIHGLDTTAPYGIDCAKTWDDARPGDDPNSRNGLMSYIAKNGFAGRPLLTLSYYDQDTNCDESINGFTNPALGQAYFDGRGAHAGVTDGHTAEAAIEHLAYHLAWFIYDRYSSHDVSVDVVAHSMGGLMIRYALGEVQNKNAAFPPKLMVGDAVTLGSPHGGAKNAKVGLLTGQCNLVGGTRECSEMRAGSGFLTTLERRAWNPQGDGSTDWTAIGSDGDKLVAADRATGSSPDRRRNLYFGACHKVWYPDYRLERQIVKVGPFQITRFVPIAQIVGHDDYMRPGSIDGGAAATNLTTYTSEAGCGAPLVQHTGQSHPMARIGLALRSKTD